MLTLLQIKVSLYRYLEKPKNMRHVVYQMLVSLMVLTSLLLGVFKKVTPEESEWMKSSLFLVDTILVTYFTVEIILRLWIIGLEFRFCGAKGRIRYLSRFINIIDFIVLGATVTCLVHNQDYSDSSVIQSVRLLQILRFLHLDRRATSWRIMERVFLLHKTELITAMYFSIFSILIMSTLVHITEESSFDKGESNSSTFSNFGDALYWSVISLLTIGYGDIVPRHWVSKLITGIFCLTFVSILTVTSSILGVGLAFMVQDEQLKKRMGKQTPLAAKLIQNYFRYRLMTRSFHKISFYRYGLMQNLVAYELSRVKQEQVANRLPWPEKYLSYSLFGTLRSNFNKRKAKLKALDTIFLKPSPSELENLNSATRRLVNDADFLDGSSPTRSIRFQLPAQNDVESPSVTTVCKFARRGNHYVLMLRFIWYLKFVVARKRFKEAMRSYDLYDVSRQLSESEFMQLQQLKTLQTKLDKILSNSSSLLFSKAHAETDIEGKVQLIECQIKHLDAKVEKMSQLMTQCVAITRRLLAERETENMQPQDGSPLKHSESQ